MNLLLIVFVIFISTVDAAPEKKKEVSFSNEAIVQAVLDLEQLQKYLHPEVSGRVPLVMSDHLIGRKLKLNKFKKKVKIVPDKTVSGAYLRFTVFKCKKDPTYCNIAFDYPIEGVSGSAGVWINPDGSFNFEKTTVSER